MSQHDIERDETGQVANPRRTQVSGGRETLREGDSPSYSDEAGDSSEHAQYPEHSEPPEDNFDTSRNDGL